jgi:hypothetical protein
MVMDWIRPLGAGVIFVALSSLSHAADVGSPPTGSEPAVPAAPPTPVQSLSPFAFGLTAGSLGIGGEFSAAVGSYFVLRATGSWLQFNPSSFLSKVNTSDNGYNFTLSQFSAGGLVDLHPFQNGFRLVGGLEYADFSFKQSVSGQSNFTINGVNYTSAQIGKLYTNVSVKNAAAPYVGVGWDSAFYCGVIVGANTAAQCDRFTIGFDLGALYTGGVRLTQTTDQSVPGLAANLQEESQKLRNSFNEFYSFYPVIMLNMKYRF